MAVDLRDPRSGFRHNEVVMFINEEVLSNGGGPDFYSTFRSRPWNEIEDELQSILADLQVPPAVKRACVWSALALSVRVATRQREQQARRVRRLQEQVGERETATWALASQLQRLREEREEVAKQLHCTRNDLQQALTEREELRGQLLQAERQPQEVVPRSQAQHLGAEAWPLTTEERNKLLVATSQRRQMEEVQREAQNVSTGGLLYMPGPPTPWSQVAQPPLPMPFPYPPPPPPTVVSEVETAAAAAAAAAAATAAAFPPQMPAGGTYPPGMWPAVVSQEEVALQRDPRIQGQQEGPVRPYFINPSGHSWSQEDPTKRQPQEQMPRPLEAPGTSCEAEGPAPSVQILMKYPSGFQQPSPQ
ncbi:testis-expressed protein 13D [Camelus dromedarius]|uniref:testis-expressed protein 13D n=1 Tax=Camelus dromedarius TaxID=9838 RepID=UPI001263E658|nr:testis-expressed protein 13D-like [Camelus dromedarius]